MYFAQYYRWLVAHRYLGISGGDSTLLDVGCHDGAFLVQQSARLRIGLDLNPQPCPDRRVLLIQADALHPPLPPASFDTIFAFNIIEHIKDDAAFLQAQVDLLTPGGTLWLSTPCVESSIWPRFLSNRLHDRSGHVRPGYSVEELQQKIPRGCRATFFEWNAPFLRLGYAPFHVLSHNWPWLALRLTALCAWLDHFFPQGGRGYLFARITETGPKSRDGAAAVPQVR
jgi:SAM-dependent methyltransferase